MMSSPYGPYRLGYTCATMKITKSNAIAKISLSKSINFFVFRLWTEIRSYEVGIISNRGSRCHGESVPRPCTHRPSQAGSGSY